MKGAPQIRYSAQKLRLASLGSSAYCPLKPLNWRSW